MNTFAQRAEDAITTENEALVYAILALVEELQEFKAWFTERDNGEPAPDFHDQVTALCHAVNR